jgi:hydrogenase maturation protease
MADSPFESATNPVPPLLVLGWGNLSRGDDALGPLCVAALQAQLPAALQGRVEFLDDYQLNIEHALDLLGRCAVLFIDASLNCAAPFEVLRPQARQDISYTSHALSPEAVLQVFQDTQGFVAPAAYLLAIRGERFELGEAISAVAQDHLVAALAWAQDWLLNSLQSGHSHA